jgi:hypothetical protein
MIVVIDGLAGSGKTWLMSRLMFADWKRGAKAYINLPVHFKTRNVEENTDVFRWHQLDELFNLNNGIIGIDEGQKLFDARRWQSLPVSFAEKIGQHRHHHLDIYTTTQNIAHIDARVRQNVHELYTCTSLIRLPRDERQKPYFQMIKVVKKQRSNSGETERLTWKVIKKRFYFISKFWTRTLYDTYGDIGFEQFICKIKREKGKWVGKIYSRDLINQGKAKLK